MDSLREAQQRQFARLGRLQHVTRMMPRRRDELLDGGSLYWVIKNYIAARQKLVAISETIGDDGIKRARIELAMPLILTRSRRRRPFQGWRYLKAEDAPPDLQNQNTGSTDGDEALHIALSEAGLA